MANPAISTWSALAGRRLLDRVQMDLMVHRVKTPGLTVMQQQATGFVLRDGAHGRAQFLPVNQVGGFGESSVPLTRLLRCASSVQDSEISAVNFDHLIHRNHQTVPLVRTAANDGIV